MNRHSFRKTLIKLSLGIAALSGMSTHATELNLYSLPLCQKSEIAQWHNCWGIVKYGDDKYEGEWRNGKRNGIGKYTHYISKTVFFGGWKDDKKDGLGITDLYNEGKSLSINEYKSGELHGKTIRIESNKKTSQSIWDNGKLVKKGEVNLPSSLSEVIDHYKKITRNFDDGLQTTTLGTDAIEAPIKDKVRTVRNLQLQISNTPVSVEGDFVIGIQTNTDTASLKINGEEQGGKLDGNYTVKRVARAGIETQFKIVATDVNGNTDTKILTISRPIIDTKPAYPPLNPALIKRQANRDAVAIIIGIADYKSLPKADFANDDARLFYDYAIRALGIKPENIKLLVDADADEVAILKAFRTWLPSRVRSTTDVYVYYSGHGYPAQDGNSLYLLPPRADREFIARTAIQLQEINNDLQTAKPKSVTIFLDACYSGQARNGETLVANARPVLLATEKKLFPDNFTVITASQSDQWSSSSPDLQHGIFSYYLMRGMEGEADANRDGKITLGEMQVYLVENVGRQAATMSRKQQPQLIGNADSVLVGR